MPRTITLKYSGSCDLCGEPIPKGRRANWIRRGIIEHIDCDRAADDCPTCGGAGEFAGGRPCRACDGTGVDMTQARETIAERDRRDGLRTFEGDGSKLFAKTRYGWRAGYEHTGRRCEDAPCCGCCS
jgi:hypothetical protein